IKYEESGKGILSLSNKKIFMSVTASAVIASSLLAADGADATLNTDAQKFEAPWTVSLKHDLKVKEIDAEKVLKKRVVKAEKEETDVIEEEKVEKIKIDLKDEREKTINKVTTKTD